MNRSEIEAFMAALETATLPRAEWTHARHLVMALWYLARHPREQAIERIRGGIQRLNASHGNPAGYHETITLAWVEVIAGFLHRHDPATPLADLATALLDSRGERDYLLRYYARERLFSDEARRAWVAPDRAPFP